jgi:glucose/arabinose dehydrogenase
MKTAAQHRFVVGLALTCAVLIAGACSSSEEIAGDAGSGNDAGLSDAGTHDAGPNDAGSSDAGPDGGTASIPSRCNGSVATAFTPVSGLHTVPAGLTVPTGFTLESIAVIGGARELAALPNGDLLIATSGTSVMLIPNAEADTLPGAPVTFTSINDAPAQGIAYAADSFSIYVATQHGLYSMAYVDAQKSATAGAAIAQVRTGGVAPNSDGDVHTSSSVAVSGNTVYIGVGSSCNQCTETDATRAAVLTTNRDGSNLTKKATRIRNAIALATNPLTGAVWVGGAGQDNLPAGHPYEYFDPVTSHSGVADYGWPACEENQHAYTSGADCSNTVAPRVELPAYSTLIGAVFYPLDQGGTYAFPAARRGTYITGHGSWHKTGNAFDAPPHVVFVPMSGDTPDTAVNWGDPRVQWTEFSGGWQTADGTARIARAAGITVGSRGSLFVSDDQGGNIFRIRPSH